MRRWILLLIMTVIMIPTIPSYAQDKTNKVDKVDKVVTTKVLVETGERLTRREKRELGILLRQIIFELKSLANDGEITKEMTPREIAAVIMIERASSAEYGGAWRQVSEGTYAVNWEELAIFLEKIVELLLKILPLFL